MRTLTFILSCITISLLTSCERGPKYTRDPNVEKAGESIPKHDVDTLAGKDKTRITDSMSGKKAR